MAHTGLPSLMERNLTQPDTPLPGICQETRKCKRAELQPGSRLQKGKISAPRSDMGNHCCCARGWNCPSLFKRKKEKPGTTISKPTPQHPDSKKGSDIAPVYDDVSDFPVYATVSKPKHLKRDENSVHYADIQVFSKARERSAEEVKSLQTQNATEYATLNFPRTTLKYDSKNGTLV